MKKMNKEEMQKFEKILEEYCEEINENFLEKIFSKKQYEEYFDFIEDNSINASRLKYLSSEQIAYDDLYLHIEEIKLMRKAKNLSLESERRINYYMKEFSYFDLLKRDK